MAFNEKEKQIIEWAKTNGKSSKELRDELFRFRQTGKSASERGQKVPETSTLKKVADVGIGFAKGVAQTGFEIARQQPPVLGLGPIGIGDISEEQTEVASELLKSDSPEQTAGKVLAFGAEILAPLPKAGAIKFGEKVLTSAKSKLGIKTDNARDAVEEAASRVGIKLEDALNPIDDGVETVLRRTDKSTFNKYVETAQKASVEPKAITGLEVAGKKAEDALGAIQKKLNEFGRQKSVILDKAAVGNKPVGSIVTKFRQNLNSMTTGRTLTKSDQRLISEIESEAKKLGNNPNAKQVDEFIDFVQDKVFTSGRNLTIDVTEKTTGDIRRFSGQLNEALKDQLPDAYRASNDNFSNLIGLRNELNQKLGKEGERAGSLMKRVFSPSDARTKEMFQEVLDITNIDLVDEAVLARYTMKVFGDRRQQSLLEDIIGGGGGVTARALRIITDKALGKFKGTDAELNKALRIIEESQLIQ